MRAHHLLERMTKEPKADAPENLKQLYYFAREGLKDAITIDMRAVTIEKEHATFGVDLIAKRLFTLPFYATLFLINLGEGNIALLSFYDAETGLHVIPFLPAERGREIEPIPALRAHASPDTKGVAVKWEYVLEREDSDRERLNRMADQALALAAGAAVLLMSKETVTTIDRPSQKLNDARRKKGRPEIRETRIITLRPDAIVAKNGTRVTGTHKSPIMHWRRGHFRTLNRGHDAERVIPVAPSLVGASDEARAIAVPKDYLVVEKGMPGRSIEPAALPEPAQMVQNGRFCTPENP